MFLALLFSGATNFRDALSPVVICLVGGVVGLCTRLLWHHGLLVLLLIGAGVTFLAVRVLLSLLLLLLLLVLSLMTTVTALVIRVLLVSCLFFPSTAGAVQWLLARQGSIMHLLLLLVLGCGLHVGGVGEGV